MLRTIFQLLNAYFTKTPNAPRKKLTSFYLPAHLCAHKVLWQGSRVERADGGDWRFLRVCQGSELHISEYKITITYPAYASGRPLAIYVEVIGGPLWSLLKKRLSNCMFLNPWDCRNISVFQVKQRPLVTSQYIWQEANLWRGTTHGPLSLRSSYFYVLFMPPPPKTPPRTVCVFLLNAYFIWMQISLQLPYRRLSANTLCCQSGTCTVT